MDSVTLKIPITIKSKVTEDLKKRLATEIQDGIKKAEAELQQIEFHGKRLLTEQAKQDAQGLIALRQQIDAEKGKRLDFKNQMLEKLKETAQLEIGSEIVQGTMERNITLKIGDDLQKLMGAEILLEDGKIVAFRD